MRKNKPLYVNLGSGTNVVKSTSEVDWINVDNFFLPEAENFIQADITCLPFEKESVDYILADQVLEHISMKDIPSVLHEIRRVLKVGGKAVIITPDFPSIVNQWNTIDHNRNFEPYLFHYLSEVVYGNQIHEGEYHKTPMTGGFLHYSFNMVGLPKHEITLHLTGSPAPIYPGVPPYDPKTTKLRNSQLVVVAYKQ